jgi:urate oxidase
MTKEETLYTAIGQNIKDAEQSQMFGKPCFKINGKAFVCFFQNQMVFKLTDSTHSEALSLDRTKLFDPSGKNRPMKEWVQVPYEYEEKWKFFAQKANEYVATSLTK